jgi:hypothetical protein
MGGQPPLGSHRPLPPRARPHCQREASEDVNMPDGEHLPEDAPAPGSQRGTHQAGFRQAQGAVGMRARRGEPLSTIEDEVIAPSGLPEQDKSALRRQGSSHLDSGRRRYEQRQDQFRRQAGLATAGRGRE